MKGHWTHTCRTFKHLFDLYQASLKKKGKNMEANFSYQDDDPFSMIHLDVADFFQSTEEKTNVIEVVANTFFHYDN